MRQNTHLPVIAVAVFVFAFGGRGMGAPMEDGQAAYNRGDFATALELWRPLAEQGEARAQNNLGVMYENGKGVPEDIAEALKWYQLAAEQGYAGAHSNLGLAYALGKGVQPDAVLAHMWLSLAASSLTGDVGARVTESRDVVASTMTAEQIAQATELAERCTASSYKQCGGDGPVLASVQPGQLDDSELPATPAIATTSHEVTVDDYPADSIRLHESGAVTVTYVVSNRGTVTSCSTVLPSGTPRLDTAACAMVMKRWKYKPATNRGRPVPIQYISKIVFPPR